MSWVAPCRRVHVLARKRQLCGRGGRRSFECKLTRRSTEVFLRIVAQRNLFFLSCTRSTPARYRSCTPWVKTYASCDMIPHCFGSSRARAHLQGKSKHTNNQKRKELPAGFFFFFSLAFSSLVAVTHAKLSSFTKDTQKHGVRKIQLHETCSGKQRKRKAKVAPKGKIPVDNF